MFSRRQQWRMSFGALDRVSLVRPYIPENMLPPSSGWEDFIVVTAESLISPLLEGYALSTLSLGFSACPISLEHRELACDRSVSITTKYRLHGRGSIPSSRNRGFSSELCPNWLWGSPSPPVQCIRGHFHPEVHPQECETYHLPLSSARAIYIYGLVLN